MARALGVVKRMVMAMKTNNGKEQEVEVDSEIDGHAIAIVSPEVE